MRIAHLADSHLGYRAYNRLTSQGVNRREADVFKAFRAALEKVAEIQPDLVVMAGDLFHVVRPSNLCIHETYKAFAGLRNRLRAPVIIIGGNHDSPRSADTGCILDLFTTVPGIVVAHKDYEVIRLAEIDTAVACLPYRAVQKIEEYKIEPAADSRRNVLVVHGTTDDLRKRIYDPNPISPSQIALSEWDYVAFGHYHTHHRIADNAYYAGAMEFTSFNLWDEAGEPKGFIEYDLDEHRMLAFHEVPTREVISLRPMDAAGRTAEELSRAIVDSVEGANGGHRDKIIRLVVENVPRAIQADLDYPAFRRLRTEALHLELQLRPPEASSARGEAAATGPARTLEEEWRDFVAAYQLPAGVEREALTDLGLEYLARAGADEVEG